MPSSTFLNLPAEKQEKLLEAATREFSHRPFNEASINQIIKEAGIPRGSFYMYFQDKEDLFRYLLKGYVDQLFMLLEEFLLRNGGDIFQALLDLYDYVQAKIDNQHLGEIGAMTGIIRCNSGMQKNGLLEMLDAETLLQRLGGAVNPDLLDLRQDSERCYHNMDANASIPLDGALRLVEEPRRSAAGPGPGRHPGHTAGCGGSHDLHRPAGRWRSRDPGSPGKHSEHLQARYGEAPHRGNREQGDYITWKLNG